MDPKTNYFLKIFHGTKQKLYNFVLKMTSDRMLTEDIVQDIYTKFFESIENLRSSSSAEFWLFTTARNEIYQYYRKKSIHRDKYNPMNVDEIEISTGESLEEKFEMEDIKKHLQEQLIFMPAEQKEVFLLKEYGGFSYKEIAVIMDTNVELVKSRLHKVRKKIIERLSKIIN